MEFKSLSGLVLLLVLQAISPFQPASADAAPASAAGAGKPAIAARAGEKVKVDADWDRDLFAIFREGAETEKSAPSAANLQPKKNASALAPKKHEVPRELKLKGIVISDDDQGAALVDGKIVRPGDTVDGWLVRRITRRGLLLEDLSGGRKYELSAGNERATVRSCAVVAPN